MEDFNGKTAYALYSSFAISPGVEDGEEDGYRLFVSGFKNGGAGEDVHRRLLKLLVSFFIT